MRVAVVGVPRGGTSTVVGLLRIAGFLLPADDPVCYVGESRVYRPDGRRNLKQIAARVNTLPYRTVWKDPQVARYAELVDWSRWRIVRVTRDHAAVGESERRWSGQLVGPMTSRAREWNSRLNLHLPEPHITLAAEDVAADPARALAALTVALGLVYPTQRQLGQAVQFVQLDGGYRCPLPADCSLPHPPSGTVGVTQHATTEDTPS